MSSASSAALLAGLELISQGDIAHYEGDRRAARALYLQAEAEGEPAARAMARVRLVSSRGNLRLKKKVTAIDADLRASVGSPWAWLARADFYWMLYPQVPELREEAQRMARQALPFLPCPALARLYLTTGDPSLLDRMAESEGCDGLATSVLKGEGQLPASPGTWALGVGPAGSPELGVGLELSFQHPDWWLRSWKLQTGLMFISPSTYALDALVLDPRARPGVYTLGSQDLPFIDYEGDLRLDRGHHEVHRLGVGKLLPLAGGSTSLVAELRVDRMQSLDPDWQWAPGLRLESSWDRSRGPSEALEGYRFESLLEGSLLTPHLGSEWVLRGYRPQLGGVGAARWTLMGAWLNVEPLYRLPTAGGSDLHRGAWSWRYRAPWISTADLEQRWVLSPRWRGVLFLNGAWVLGEGLHPGGGGGLRFFLREDSPIPLRLDVAGSDSGWGIWTGVGEVF